MKKFNLSKGLIVGLLTLALCFACFGAVKASAVTITLNPGYGVPGNPETASDTSGAYTLPTSSVSGWNAPEHLTFNGWSYSMSGEKISGSKISTSGETNVTLYALWKVKDAALYGAVKYDPETDSIVVKTNYQAGTANFAILKDAAATDLKANNFKVSATTTAVSGETAKYGDVVYSTSGGFSVSVPLSGKSSKLKIAESKDGYVAVTLKKPAGKDTVNLGASITIKKTDIKKLVVNFDYVSAMSGGNALAISSINVTPTDGDAYTSVSGDAKWDGLIARLQYSTDDGKNWYPVNAETANSAEITAGSAESTLLNSNKLYKLTQAKKATKMSFRLVGTESPAMRTSKAFKASVKTAGKAEKKLKINVATNSIVIKNGYDFYVTANSGDKPSAENFDSWMTILPVNKDITDVDAFKPTNLFVPFKKPDDSVATSKSNFTGTKVKEVTIDKFCGCFEDVSASSGDIYVYIRKSAGVGKPAGQWNATPFVIAKQIAEPTPTTSGETTLIAASGKKGELKGQFSGSGSALEILVIKKTDYDNNYAKIDWSKTKWAKYNSSKGITVGKTATKVCVGDSADKVTLDDDCYVLVRYAGDKKSGKLASPATKTTVTKTTSASGDTSTWEAIR